MCHNPRKKKGATAARMQSLDLHRSCSIRAAQGDTRMTQQRTLLEPTAVDEKLRDVRAGAAPELALTPEPTRTELLEYLASDEGHRAVAGELEARRKASWARDGGPQQPPGEVAEEREWLPRLVWICVGAIPWVVGLASIVAEGARGAWLREIFASNALKLFVTSGIVLYGVFSGVRLEAEADWWDRWGQPGAGVVLSCLLAFFATGVVLQWR
jgi:hypothetical protein